MVIASNEWLNNYEDEQKPPSVTTTATATATTTSVSDSPDNNPTRSSSTSTSATATATTNTVINSVISTITSTSSTTTTTTTISPATTSERISKTAEINSNTIEPFEQLNRQQQPPQQTPGVSMVNTKRLMMDDSLKSDRETNEIENNNRDLANTAFISQSPPSANSLSNTSIATILGSSSTNIITAQTHINSTIGPTYNPSPITPQALSNALQSALSATSNNATVAINLPNSFLCSLGNVGISPNATLQHTANLAKQLSSSLSALESQALASNNQHGDSNADNSMRGDHHHQQMIDNNGQAKIVLHCEPNSHPFQTRTILLTPNIECKVGRLIAKSKATESNAIFDCKVLSRNHAVLWYSNDGKFWVKDTKSSNGTFINENKLGTESAELHFGDVVKFGVDVMENSRKEVHGCIIAGVKLYLPDGRETISIELNTNQLPAHSGESRISFDELHRLNLYMQEASQREKLLKSKLYNIQNILDATRKNSALCWQSLIAEDQLLHRIHSLEKKLQLMEKNVPESVLRNEVLKLLDDKSSYQHSAKEALRKVYQERCDAMQMLSKMESAYIASDDECKILRDQIMNTKQSLQDVNARLLGLEAEYNEFKEENDRKQQEAKEQSDQRTAELMETLQQRDLDCEELRRKISELLLKRAEMLDNGDDDDEQKLAKQAIEKLDAAIADVMDLEDDDDDDDDDGEEDKNNEEDDDERDGKQEEKINSNLNAGANKKEKEKFYAMIDGAINEFSGDSGNEKEKTDVKSPKSCVLSEDGVATKQKVGKKSTILKWLENSDLNEKEGSIDIFNAICNESDSSDGSSGKGAGTNEQLENNNKSDPLNNDDNHHSEEEEGLTSKCKNFNEKLRNVQQNLSKLEAEIANEMKNAENVKAETSSVEVITEEFTTEENAKESHEDGDDDDNNLESEAEVKALESPPKSNGSAKFNVISSNNTSYMLLKSSVSMLREAYNEICDNMKQQERQRQRKQQQRQNKETPTISVHTKLKNYARHKISKSAGKKLASQLTLLQTSRSPEAESEEEEKIPNSYVVNEHDTGEEEEDDDDDDVPSEATARLSLTSLQTIKEIVSADEEETSEHENGCTVVAPVATDESSSTSTAGSSSRVNSQEQQHQQQNIDGVMKVYQYEIKELRAKLELSETDSQNTLELMQVECDTFKDKVAELSKLVETLNEEKRALEEVIAQNKSNAEKTEACFKEESLPTVVEPEVISECKLTELSSINKGDYADVAVVGKDATAASAQPQEEQIEGHQRVLHSVRDDDSGDPDQRQAFEQQLQEELEETGIELEEELIMYKERLDQSQSENLRLRNEISEMVLATDAYTMNLLKRLVPYGAVVVAILVYFIFTYL